MQSYLQYRGFRRQLETQIVQEDQEKPSKPDGRGDSQDRGVSPGEEGRTGRSRNVGRSRTLRICPHSERLDMEPTGDIDQADFQTEIEGNVSTINTREAMGNTVSLTVRGVEVPPTQTATNDIPGGDDKMLVVSFEGEDDPMDPHNWTLPRRLVCTFIVCLTGAAVEFGTVIDSPHMEQAAQGVGTQLEPRYLLTGMFLIGLGAGSLITGPFSEFFGRNPVYIVTLAMYMSFVLATEYGPTRGIRIMLRGFAAFVGSASSVCTSGSVADLWSRLERGYIFPVYTCSVFMAPLLAAIVNGFLVEHYKRGHLSYWASLVFAGIAFIAVVMFQPETYSPILLQWKAKQLRKLTGDSRYRAPIQLKKVSFWRRLRHALYRPFLFMFKDGLLTLVGVYMALNYVIVYTLFAGIPFTFGRIYHWSAGFVGLSFLASITGVLLCGPAVLVAWRRLRKEMVEALEQERPHLEPEISLYLAVLGAPAIPVALFWMGWTARPSISFWSPLASTSLFAYGVICVTISIFQYVTDSFESHTASAQAAVIMLRYVSAGAMAQAAVPLYVRLGVGLTLTIFGILSVVVMPIPLILYKHGHRARRRSTYSLSPAGASS
ncbi:major facilitator superfamily domain-containing protein [Thermoascus aurantiacus ATCC 26904]